MINRLKYFVGSGLILFAISASVHATSNESDTSNKIAVTSPAAAAHSSLGTDSVPTVRAALPTHQAPAPRRAPLEVMALGAVVGATKRSTRRAAGKPRDVPMFLDSEAHVMRKNDDGEMVTTVIRGGVLVDDTDLEDDEIDELTARRVVRPATTSELERLDRTDAAAKRADLVAEQETELAQLRANNEQRRSALVADGTKAEDLVTFDTKAAEAVSTLQTKHAAAINKLDAQ